MSISETVKPISTALRACASLMEAAGIGNDPATGHSKILNRVADHMDAEAAAGRTPRAYGENSVLRAAGAVVNQELAAKGQAAAAKNPNITRYLRDLDLTPGAGARDGRYPVAQVDQKLEAAAATHPGVYGRTDQRAAVKWTLRDAGLIAA